MLDENKEGMKGETMKQVKEKEDEHMYHVLDGPTIVQVECVGWSNYYCPGRVCMYQHNLIVTCFLHLPLVSMSTDHCRACVLSYK